MHTPTKLERLVSQIKHWVYVAVLPIYLWSIGYKTLEAYISDIEKDYEAYRTQS